MGGFKFETKATSALNEVGHKDLKASSGGVGAALQLEYKPDFDLAGRALSFKVNGTEQSLLNPSKLTGVSATAKASLIQTASLNSSVQVKYALDKKKVATSTKIDTTRIGGRKLETEVRWAPGADVAVETELHVTKDNKLQVETIGSRVDSVKGTHARGKTQLKVKYVLPSKAAVIGVDTYYGSQKWDLEYNVKSGNFDGKVKVYPMTLAANTNIGKNGLSPITYKVTAERTFSF